MWLVQVIRLPLLVVDLVMKDQKKLISSGIIHLSEIRILQESVLKYLPEYVLLEELIILSLKYFDLAKSIFLLGTLINTV